jgi:hypothetical protein
MSCETEIKPDALKKNIATNKFTSFIQEDQEKEENDCIEIISCHSCGAQIILDENILVSDCSFCSSLLDSSAKNQTNRIKPEGILPFQISQLTANKQFKSWLNKQWLAPKGFIRESKLPDKLTGIYIPYWSFDADTVSDYEGSLCVCGYISVKISLSLYLYM